MEKFDFYCGYMDLFKDLSSRQFRKVIQALVDYASEKKIPDNLPKKSLNVFYKIKLVIDVEWREYKMDKSQEALSEIRSKAGKKGAKVRWN